MEGKKSIVYTASSVGVDYFIFLSKTIERAGYNVKPLFLISEKDYRSLSRSHNFDKLVLRCKMYLLYPFYLIKNGFCAQKGSIFIVSSNTFFAPFLMRILFSRRKLKVVHLLYDLFPDALEVSGKLNTDSVVSRTIGRLINYTLENCDYTVFLGEVLRKHTESRWGKAKNSEVIDISTDLNLYSSDFLSLTDTSTIIVHYGGQLGHLHDADTLISCIKFVLNSDIKDQVKFNFYVSGSQATYLEQSLEGERVEILSTIPSSQWREDIRQFHIGLVSLSPGGAYVCLPSKTYGMMGGGMAILAICPEWSDLAKLVLSTKSGKVINNSKDLGPKDFKASSHRELQLIANDFYVSLKQFVLERDYLEEKRANAFRRVRENYSIEELSYKWKFVLERIS